ncbi:MAG: YbeD family protein [Candidatus Competibacterales bacterium]
MANPNRTTPLAEHRLTEQLYPCTFPIKAVGHNADDFAALVVALVAPHAPEVQRQTPKVQYSRQRRYQSVTVVITARSRAHIDAIYRDLNDHERVVTAL